MVLYGFHSNITVFAEKLFDHQNRARGGVEYPGGYTADDKTFQAGQSTGAHDDEITLLDFCDIDNNCCRRFLHQTLFEFYACITEPAGKPVAFGAADLKVI